MEKYLAEIIGTLVLVLLGDGVVANVVLNRTKGNNSGWIVIAIGWACAVLVPALIFGRISGAFFNPALTVALACINQIEWNVAFGFILCQFLGAFIGACLVYLQYKDHFDATADRDSKLAVFCTGPAIRDIPFNFISEFIGTFILVFAILGIGKVDFANGLGTFGVGGIILVIGICLGGTTGYAINPARDLGPRIAHFLLPIKDKRDPDWAYSWVPVVAPVCGAVSAALLGNAIF